MNMLTISKNLKKASDLIVMEKSDYEKLEKENMELRMAVSAIVSGEKALRQGKTRSLKSFLSLKFSHRKYAKSS